MTKLLFPLLLTGTLALAGCGNKGPLVMPDQSPQTSAKQQSTQH